MHISQIEISNIRSYSFAHLDLSPSVNLLVGENNAGKSTILKCAMIVQKVQLNANAVRFGEAEGRIRIRVSNIDRKRFHVNHQMGVQNPQLEFVDIAQRLASPNIVEKPMIGLSSGSVAFQPFENEQPRNCIETYFSRRTSGDFSQTVNAGMSRAIGGDKSTLVAKIDTCITSTFLRTRFLDACKQVVGFHVSTWPVENGKMAGLEVDPTDGHVIPLDDLGSGVSQAVGLISTLLVAKQKVFLIEELENDLHPNALRSLLALIESSAIEGGNQFIISTHSSTVIRYLGGIKNGKVFHVDRENNPIPTAKVREVEATSESRQALLRALGYQLSDLELWSAWLLLEESSAELIIGEFLVPLFAPKLVGRLRTMSTAGASEIEPRFIEFHRLFLYVHLEPVYRQRAWVFADGDEAGSTALQKLRSTFKDWPKNHFVNFQMPSFEHYFPAHFSNDVTRVLSISDDRKRRQAKRELLLRVAEWLRADTPRAAAALEASAAEVIALLREIERNITGAQKSPVATKGVS